MSDQHQPDNLIDLKSARQKKRVGRGGFFRAKQNTKTEVKASTFKTKVLPFLQVIILLVLVAEGMRRCGQ